MAALVDSTVESLRLHAEQCGLRLQSNVAADVPAVEADATRIGQVLRNLLNNAMDFTPRGGEVSVNAHVREHFVDVEVRDTGPGIAAEHLPFVFERFYRVDPSRTRATGGAGLGLTIVKSLVEAHGGRVWVRSEPGAGSTFGFSLPLAAQPGGS
jgi:two-component system sensor histidine kinase BaeS